MITRQKIFLLFALFFLGTEIQAQTFHLRGTIPGMSNSDVFLLEDFADSQKMVDTAKTDISGTFDFTFKKDMPVGMYRIMTPLGQVFNVIYNHENIAFEATGLQGNDQIKVEKSIENLIYYKYLHVKSKDELRINILMPVLQYYPPADTFYAVIRHQVEKLQEETAQVTHTLIAQNPGTLAAHFIAMDQPVYPPATIPATAQEQWIKKHYLDHVDFNDTLLLRTRLFTAKLVGYLSLYQKDGMDKKAMEKAFTAPVDTLLKKARVNEKMYLFTLGYFLKGFQSFGFEHLLEHIAKTQNLSSLQGNDPEKLALESQLQIIRRLAIGKTAPDFKAKTLKGKKIQLSKINAQHTLLVFWASWCPHCTATLPKLKKYYDPAHPEKLQVIAISVDNDRKSLEKEIKKEGYLWPNIARLKGWDSPIALEYGISSTPTFILLDKDKKIVAKPGNLHELEQLLNTIEKKK